MKSRQPGPMSKRQRRNPRPPRQVACRAFRLSLLSRPVLAASCAPGLALGQDWFRSLPRVGGLVEVLLEGLDAPTGLAADDRSVFVCTRGTELNDYRGRILRRSDEGVTSTLTVNQWQAFAIAVDERAVYFTTDADGGLHAILR